MSLIAVQGGATGTGTVTLLAPVTSTNRVLTLPDATGTVLSTATSGVPIGGPCFSAYQSVQQTIASASTFTKITFTSTDFDITAGMFSSSRFTPTVAGYYQVNAGVTINSATWLAVNLYKNGTTFKSLFNSYNTTMNGGYGSVLVYCNGSTDYLEIYTSVGTTSVTIANTSSSTYFQAAMVRSAT